jgi:transposase
MSRHALTDEQWAVIEPLIPERRRGRGRPRADDRPTLNGILHVLQTGCAWEDLPREYGAAVTCWRRLQRWSGDGTWERVWRALLSALDAQGTLEWSRAFLDGSFVPAKKGAPVSARPRSARARK